MVQNPNCRHHLLTALSVRQQPDETLKHTDLTEANSGHKRTGNGENKSRLLKGQPVAPGVTVGSAVVIQKFGDLQRVNPHSILVCSRMSPLYSIVFQLVRGITSERGSILSSAATIAREYGLPAITGIPSLCQLISDGDLIRVDGFEGSAQIISKARQLWNDECRLTNDEW